jgi:hypothetical protein
MRTRRRCFIKDRKGHPTAVTYLWGLQGASLSPPAYDSGERDPGSLRTGAAPRTTLAVIPTTRESATNPGCMLPLSGCAPQALALPLPSLPAYHPLQPTVGHLVPGPRATGSGPDRSLSARRQVPLPDYQ